MLAMGTRILLLLSLAWMMKLTAPLFTVLAQAISGRDLILILGGLFLLWKSVHEIHASLEGPDDEPSAVGTGTPIMPRNATQPGLQQHAVFPGCHAGTDRQGLCAETPGTMSGQQMGCGTLAASRRRHCGRGSFRPAVDPRATRCAPRAHPPARA